MAAAKNSLRIKNVQVEQASECDRTFFCLSASHMTKKTLPGTARATSDGSRLVAAVGSQCDLDVVYANWDRGVADVNGCSVADICR